MKVEIGFGFSLKTKEYKVVQIFFEDNQGSGLGEVYVYTLGSCNWRCISKLTYTLIGPLVFVAGFFHWFDDKKQIVSFDLVPPLDSIFNTTSNYNLGCLKGRLCLIQNLEDEKLKVWLMDEDSIWRVKHIVIIQRFAPLNNDDSCYIISISQSGKILLWFNEKMLGVYDPETQAQVLYGEYKKDHYHEIVIHEKNLISMKEMGEVSELIFFRVIPNQEMVQTLVSGADRQTNEHVSGLDKVVHVSQLKPTSVEADSQQEGESDPSEKLVSQDKVYCAALLKSLFADTILKAQEKTLIQGEKGDPEKQRCEREELERQQREEKARLQAEVRAAEDARRQAKVEADAEAKRKLELERQAARQALLQMEKTVEINENSPFLEDLEMLTTFPEELLLSVEDTSPDPKFQGASNPLEEGEID